MIKAPKKIISFATIQTLLKLVDMGKVRIVKEHGENGPVYVAFNASGGQIGIIGPKYKYLFEKKLSEAGAEDGLFEGHSQTSVGAR